MADKPPQSVVAKVRRLMKADPKLRGSVTKGSVPADELVAMLFEHNGSAYKVAKLLGTSASNIADRRKFLEQSLQITLPRGRPEVWRENHALSHTDLEMENGVIIVGGDLHAWPEIYGTAMAAYVDFHRRLKPDWSILNGDGLDGAKISSHPKSGWENLPDTSEELGALRDFLGEVRSASPGTKRKRTKGNHDARFDRYFASQAAEVKGVRGTCLADHLDGWDEVMSLTINGNIIVQHRYRNGIHAVYNNVRDYGCHVITNHRHQQEVRAWTNQLGTWYGMDTGTLAPLWHPGFGYTEQRRPTNWRSGFGVLTIKDWKLMPPETVQVTDEERGEVYFRGQTLRYDL